MEIHEFSLLLTATISLVTTLTYAFLYFKNKDYFLKIWVINGIVLTIGFVIGLYSGTEPTNFMITPIYQLFLMLSAIPLKYGVNVLLEKPISKYFFFGELIITIWILVANNLVIDFIIVSIPMSIFLCYIYIHLGLKIYKHGEIRGTGKKVFGFSLIVMGIHYLDYPFLKIIPDFPPWAIYIVGATIFIASIGILIMFHEKIEDKLKIARNASENANREKSEFLVNVSHELRTPLNSILGFAELLSLEGIGKLTDDQKESVHIISESGSILLNLINDILDISKIEAGKVKLNLSKFNLNEIINTICTLLKEKLNSKNQELNYEFMENLTVVIADEQRIKQILLNLIGNAVKFTPLNGRIDIETKISGNNFLVEVSDTGIGISEENIKLLFKKFSRLDNTKKKAIEGTGIGLYFSKLLVKLHGGEIWVTSKINKGSKFSFSIPIIKSEKLIY